MISYVTKRRIPFFFSVTRTVHRSAQRGVFLATEEASFFGGTVKVMSRGWLVGSEEVFAYLRWER